MIFSDDQREIPVFIETKCLVVCFSIALSGVWCLIHFGCLRKDLQRTVNGEKIYKTFNLHFKKSTKKNSVRAQKITKSFYSKTVGPADIGFLHFVFINFHCVKAQVGRRGEN